MVTPLPSTPFACVQLVEEPDSIVRSAESRVSSMIREEGSSQWGCKMCNTCRGVFGTSRHSPLRLQQAQRSVLTSPMKWKMNPAARRVIATIEVVSIQHRLPPTKQWKQQLKAEVEKEHSAGGHVERGGGGVVRYARYRSGYDGSPDEGEDDDDGGPWPAKIDHHEAVSEGAARGADVEGTAESRHDKRLIERQRNGSGGRVEELGHGVKQSIHHSHVQSTPSVSSSFIRGVAHPSATQIGTRNASIPTRPPNASNQPPITSSRGAGRIAMTRSSGQGGQQRGRGGRGGRGTTTGAIPVKKATAKWW